jgi:peptide/nickel transport system permease protein
MKEPLAETLQSETLIEQRSAWRTLSRFLRKNPLALAGLAIVILTILIALLSQWIVPYDPIQPNLEEKLIGPSETHILGTDEMGRDVLSRIIAGTSISLGSALLIIGLSAGFGVFVGMIAGYSGGWIDDLLMRMTDIFLVFPALILAMAIGATLGPSLQNALISVAIVWWPWYARLVRGQVLSLRNREYVLAAQALGLSGFQILLWHILPNSLAPFIVQATLDVGNTILLTASLSFIGLGAQPPQPEWGAMVSSGRLYMLSYWWVPTMPGFAILISVLGFNLLGDAARDFFDVRGRSL